MITIMITVDLNELEKQITGQKDCNEYGWDLYVRFIILINTFRCIPLRNKEKQRAKIWNVWRKSARDAYIVHSQNVKSSRTSWDI